MRLHGPRRTDADAGELFGIREGRNPEKTRLLTVIVINDTLPIQRVVGVVKNFHQQSLYEPITPLLFYPSENNGNVHIRINPKNTGELKSTIASIEKEWSTVFPNTPFEFEFVDESFMELYKVGLFAVGTVLTKPLGYPKVALNDKEKSNLVEKGTIFS